MREVHQFHLFTVYFAPRGRERLLALGEQLSMIHLHYDDKLIGIVGDAGSGKSLIIKGMFPGILLSNDDDSIDIKKIMQVRNDLDKEYRSPCYHLDMRFQLAFTQMYEIVDFVRGALSKKRKVIIEHFDLLFPFLKINADLLVGIGEEIIVSRPSVFGPIPKDIYDIVFKSLKYRKMAHTCEDLTALVLEKDYNIDYDFRHNDVRGGFVISFEEKPSFDVIELEARVKSLIGSDLDISYYDENHIQIGGREILECTGPRIHVSNTSQIVGFQMVKEIVFDRQKNLYSIVGLVRNEAMDDINVGDLNKIKGISLHNE